MSGISADIFAPDMAVTRAMLVSILHRNAGSPDSSENIRFSDTASGAWYADALRWAVGNNLVSGYSDGRFGPNDPVTRKQLATILWRAEGCPSHGTAQPFTDSLAQNNAATPDTPEKRTLIVYFSYTQRTEAVAELLRSKTGCDLFALIPSEPYPSSSSAASSRAAEELESGNLPELIGELPDLTQL